MLVSQDEQLWTMEQALMQQSIIEQNKLNGNFAFIKESLKSRLSYPSFLASPLSATKDTPPEEEPLPPYIQFQK
jgi:hypothetical protein